MNLQQKIFTISTIFCLAVLLLLFLAIYPLLRGIEKSSEQFSENKKREILLENKTQNLQYFKGIYQILAEDLKKVENLFIDQKVPIDFIKFLEKTAEDSGILIDISPTPVGLRKGDLWPSLEFKITLTGSFSNCSKFIEKIETAPYLIEVQSLNLKKLTERELESPKLKQLSLNDVTGNFSIMVFAK